MNKTEVTRRILPGPNSWWIEVYSKEYYELLAFIFECTRKREDWVQSLIQRWGRDDKTLAPGLYSLRGTLGHRVFLPTMHLVVGDGVSICDGIRRWPGTVRVATPKRVEVTEDVAIRKGRGTILYLPEEKKLPFVFTKRKDGQWRLQGTRRMFLRFGRFYQATGGING
jgi:hypothetical protein